MSEDIIRKVNISFPNLVNICVDENINGELQGRIYQYYTEEPWIFTNVVQLLRLLERFYDAIDYPQAATKERQFLVREDQEAVEWQRINEPQDVLAERGRLASLVSCVQYRQNTTWQGEIFWIENNEKQRFRSGLEFIKLLDNAVEL